MTVEQLQHYLKGGKFKAIYNPLKKETLVDPKTDLFNKEIICYQNYINTPILTNGNGWMGQFRFNSKSIYGWFPEEDITITEILNKFIDTPEPLPQYLYRFYYDKEEQLLPNFGNGNWKLPLIIGREYSIENDNYVFKLSNPQASKIEKAVWNGELLENVQWETILN